MNFDITPIDVKPKQKRSPEHTAKLAKAHIGLKHTQKAKEKMRLANTGQKRSPEQIENIRLAVNSPEAIAKMIKAQTGKKQSPETIVKRAKTQTGRKHTPEHIEHSRLSHLGQKVSPETRMKHRLNLISRVKHIGIESPIHKATKEAIGATLSEIGYTVSLEKFITVDKHRYAIDVYAKKGEDVILFEVGQCRISKLLNLMSHYPIVLQVPKNNKLVYN